MLISELLDEYNLGINDVRYYLSTKIANEFIEYKNDIKSLVKYIESGELEERLYNMEERYLEELQELLDRNKADDVNIREEFSQMQLLKNRRFT